AVANERLPVLRALHHPVDLPLDGLPEGSLRLGRRGLLWQAPEGTVDGAVRSTVHRAVDLNLPPETQVAGPDVLEVPLLARHQVLDEAVVVAVLAPPGAIRLGDVDCLATLVVRESTTRGRGRRLAGASPPLLALEPARVELC